VCDRFRPQRPTGTGNRAHSYDDDGAASDQLQSRTVQGDTDTFTYDGLDRLTSDYTYDDVGNLLSAGEEEFAYNDADQVTTARGEEGATARPET
jgi:hypothetical protein